MQLVPLQGGAEEPEEPPAVTGARRGGAQLGVQPRDSRRALFTSAHALRRHVHGGAVQVDSS
jgi:hypothetical protein